MKIKQKRLIILMVSLAVAGTAIFVYARKNNSSETINYDPPTEQERSAGDEQKELLNDYEGQQNQNDKDDKSESQSSKKQVSVVITDASQYDDIIEVRSFVPDHFQDGTCTITFTKGSQTITKNTPAKTDVSTTICLTPDIKRSEFPSAGTWKVKVSYSAPSASGTSEQRDITIN